MKINLLLPTALILMLVPFSGAYSSHQETIGAADAPMPVQECFAAIQKYRELFLTRAAGMTLEETQMYNDFSFRVIKYISLQNGMAVDEELMADTEAKTLETYALPADKFFDIDWQIKWATEKFDSCIAAIPKEQLQTDDEQLDRMME